MTEKEEELHKTINILRNIIDGLREEKFELIMDNMELRAKLVNDKLNDAVGELIVPLPDRNAPMFNEVDMLALRNVLGSCDLVVTEDGEINFKEKGESDESDM